MHQLLELLSPTTLRKIQPFHSEESWNTNLISQPLLVVQATKPQTKQLLLPLLLEIGSKKLQLQVTHGELIIPAWIEVDQKYQKLPLTSHY